MHVLRALSVTDKQTQVLSTNACKYAQELNIFTCNRQANTSTATVSARDSQEYY
jgi:hypothetical protein